MTCVPLNLIAKYTGYPTKLTSSDKVLTLSHRSAILRGGGY